MGDFKYFGERYINAMVWIPNKALEALDTDTGNNFRMNIFLTYLT